MEQHLLDLKSLLLSKDSNGIKDYLEGLKATEKGLAFEQFLELVYKGNGYAAVRQGGRGDLGADILLYDPKKEGIYCIIQAKNHSSPLNRDDTAIELNKFETLASKKYGCKEFQIISINGFVASTSKMEHFRLKLRDWSYVEKLIKNYDPNNPSKPNIQLHSHNQTTFDSAIESLHEGSRVACIQATGTGKSYVIAKTMNEFSDGKKLVIAPSHYILKQQKEVVPWLESSTQYMTYKGATNLEEAEIRELNPKLIVLDEFHRAGAEAWGGGVDRILKNCPEAKVLGTTATPIRYLDGERDMSDELFDEEAVNLPLAEAIQRNILPSPEYVASLYTLNEEADNLLENLSKSALSDAEKKTIKAEAEQAKIDWEKTSGVPQILKKYLSENLNNKFIVFCKNKDHLDELEDEVRKWIRKTKLFEYRKTYRVYSKYSESDANLEAFLEAKDKNTAHILLSIDMLNEGIHAPDVGAVLLFRPTESPRIFYQQIGRCLQVGTNSKPIIFDFVNNFQSIRAGDFLSDLQEAGETERELREEFGLSADYLPEIHVHDESRAILETFQEINERLGSWEINFQKLVAYKEEHGDCLVPYEWEEDKKLACWVAGQRSGRKRGRITADTKRFKRLDEIGFVWDIDELAWKRRFEELRSYHQQFGNCRIQNTHEFCKLRSWAVNQRTNKNLGLLSSEKINLLNGLGFIWHTYNHAWDEKYKELLEFEKSYGHCVVPRSGKTKELGGWVIKQREKNKKGTLREERVTKLDQLNFVWDVQEELWHANYKDLVTFQKANGSCIVPDNTKLGSWVYHQRYAYQNNALETEKIKLLEELGFVWGNIDDFVWQENYEKLLEYYEEHGDCLVPRGWSDEALANWVGTQRQFKRKLMLKDDRLEKLNALGFVWDPREHEWNMIFESLVKHKKKSGHCLVSSLESKPLANWVINQRMLRKKGKLPDDRIKRLNEIEFIWDPRSHEWEQQFQALEAYQKRHGDCLVPRSEKNKTLATWITSQRERRNSGKLDDEKIARLENLGFFWDPNEELWDQQFQALEAYRKRHDNCLVPRSEKNKTLATWITSQRVRRNSGKLDDEKIVRLENLGFCWDPNEELWEQQFQALEAYQKRHGDCLVPRSKNEKLAAWLNTQKTSRKKGTLESQKIKRLDELGFIWNPFERAWNENLKRLKSYRKEHGDCLVPYKTQLGKWVGTQRMDKKKGRLDAKRIKRLDEVGFVWEVKK
ncbi:Helicase associated domain protein [Akkermansiaceae bacterium]|nr:Helicase associated domain protein [Akkermansiaceae bacterium]